MRQRWQPAIKVACRIFPALIARGADDEECRGQIGWSRIGADQLVTFPAISMRVQCRKG